VVPITSFLPSVKGLEFLLLHRGSPVIIVGSTRSLCSAGSRFPSTSRVADCHLEEDLEFQLLDRRDVTLL
jgi:hypothetical protein